MERPTVCHKAALNGRFAVHFCLHVRAVASKYLHVRMKIGIMMSASSFIEAVLSLRPQGS